MSSVSLRGGHYPDGLLPAQPSPSVIQLECQRYGILRRKRFAPSICHREIQRLQAEEAAATSHVAAEQTRWIDINQRLEELERMLMRR